MSEGPRELSKAERSALAEKNPLLRTHRFRLSENPEFREKLRILSKEFRTLQKQFPEIVSLQVFGSRTKAYEGQSSDYDLALPIDMRKLKAGKRTEEELVKAVRAHLATALSTTEDKVNIEYYPVYTNEPRMQFRYEIFLLSLGSGIRKYREKIIKDLEKDPEGEEEWKRMMENLHVRENLSFVNPMQADRKSLYPMKLSQARDYFLRKRKKTTRES